MSATTLFPPCRLVDPSFVRTAKDGTRSLDLLVDDMHCAGCLAKVERTANAVPGVAHARANLTTKRLAVDLDATGSPEAVLEALRRAGRSARPFDPGVAAETNSDSAELIRCMAVAGFASMNVMLLSVSVWSGADGTTRDLFYWLSAMIAIPTVIYSGRPFFRSAWNALRHGRTNMDVPIAIGVTGATALSLYETITSGEHAWFDGSVALLFFLLVGRVLDNRMRDVARGAAARLLTLAPTVASLVLADGRSRDIPISSVRIGDILRVLPGERVPVDGIVTTGASDLDRALLTGESVPEPVSAGTLIHAGANNLTGPLEMRATAPANETVLAGIIRLMEKVERPDGRFVRLADRASRLYAPAVHSAAFLTMVGWLLLGFGVHPAVTAAVAVLIITCPCALGLAVPAVQVVAAGRLLSSGIILKDGAALEKLSEIDTVVFDKTGTLTRGTPVLAQGPDSGEAWSVAAALASGSRHPLSRALVEAAEVHGIHPAHVTDLAERPGFGVEARWNGVPVRLGRTGWVDAPANTQSCLSEVWLRIGDETPQPFLFSDELRADAKQTVAELQALGLDVRLISGDAQGAVDRVAAQAGISRSLAGCLPGGKVEALQALAREGRKVLMVGDGLNDAPALAAAHVSVSPASGADIAQAAAGIVFTGENLSPVLESVVTARKARRKIFSNFSLAIGYNIIAVPVAVLGYATPLIAAVSMSASSILVIANALTLGLSLRKVGK
ncbi:heavy metal translocating P-type ATPase [Tianweitania sediminis]|uniref:Cadmium-translocating P-type ATPase n=1 Tax=Tianweitania sediminis TaxID=1502156 RepID=A0A8J7RET5_9HYPH|nr:cadmium-translocating P-type ATPase [Tianweitania sediminis]